MRRLCPPVAALAWALLSISAPAAAAPRIYIVVVEKMKFGPVPAQLHKGDIVVWDNRDIFRHSVTAADHKFDVDLPAGAKVKAVMRTVGTTPFVCKYHPGMTGVLKVSE